MCEVPFRNKAPSLLSSLIVNGLKPEIPHPLPDTAVGLPPSFFQIMQQCLQTDPALRPDAHAVHQMLISIDPTARPSAPLLICPPGHPVPKGSLLDCIRHAIPSEFVLVRMMAFAEDLFKRSPRAKEIQSFCAMHSIWDVEAYTLMVMLFASNNCSHLNCFARFTPWMPVLLASPEKILCSTSTIPLCAVVLPLR